jgi:hypothetical protein
VSGGFSGRTQHRGVGICGCKKGQKSEVALLFYISIKSKIILFTASTKWDLLSSNKVKVTSLSVLNANIKISSQQKFYSPWTYVILALSGVLLHHLDQEAV